MLSQPLSELWLRYVLAGQKAKALQFFTVQENGWHSKKSLVLAGDQTKWFFFFFPIYSLKEGKRKQTNAGSVIKGSTSC